MKNLQRYIILVISVLFFNSSLAGCSISLKINDKQKEALESALEADIYGGKYDELIIFFYCTDCTRFNDMHKIEKAFREACAQKYRELSKLTSVIPKNTSRISVKVKAEDYEIVYYSIVEGARPAGYGQYAFPVLLQGAGSFQNTMEYSTFIKQNSTFEDSDAAVILKLGRTYKNFKRYYPRTY